MWSCGRKIAKEPATQKADGSAANGAQSFSGARTFLSAAACEPQHGVGSPLRRHVSRCCGQECPRSAKHVRSSALRWLGRGRHNFQFIGKPIRSRSHPRQLTDNVFRLEAEVRQTDDNFLTPAV